MVPFPTIRSVFNVLIAASLFLAVALVAPVAGEDIWKVKPSERWTVDEALKVLQDSPLAQEKDVSMPWRLPRRSNTTLRAPQNPGRAAPRDPFPGGSRRQEMLFLDSARYRVRWESARPVRDAFGRLAELGERVGADFQSPPPSLPQDRFVVTVKPVRPPQNGREPLEQLTERTLREAARLKTNAGEADAVEVTRSGMGASAAVHFYFSRSVGGKPLLDPKGDKVEFMLELRQLNLKTKFQLEPEWTE
ncbi:MAG: hypothetical protein ACRD4D_04975 [Candidatus Acidiferrales bacterium]